MHTSIVTMRLIASMLAVLLCGSALAGDKPEPPPPGMAKYVVILWRPGSPLPGNPSPGSVKKVDEPDIVKMGGRVLHKRDNQRVILLPKQAARQLRKHEAVFLLQRLWAGESFEDWKENPTADSRLDPESDALSAIEPDTDTNLQWGPKNYTYDKSGNITAIGPDAYTYDTAGRLIEASVGEQTEKYEYDSFGNLRRTEIVGKTAVAIPVDSGSNRLAGREYDAAGNVLSAPLRDRSSGWTSGSNNYVWDGLNRLAYIRGPVTQRRMIYDANDEKISTWIVTGEDETAMHWTVRDFEGRPLREFTSSTGSFASADWWIWQQDHVYGEGKLVGGETPEWGGSGGLPEYGGKRHVHLDHLGSVRMVTNDDHRSLSEHDYYPFGITQTPTHQEDFTFGDQSEPAIDSFRFAGHQRDYLGWLNLNTTEYLDYMHARVYDPNLGRFLSVDPHLDVEKTIHEPQQWNRYSYVVNNPLKYTDPDGEDKLAAWLLGPSYANVSTWDAIFSRDTITDINRGRQAFAEDHAQLTGGFSPVPTSRTGAMMTVLFAGLGGGVPTRVAEGVTGFGFRSFEGFKRVMGSAGANQQWHHIVEQTAGNAARFGQRAVHNTVNLIRVGRETHGKISGYYSSKQAFTGGKTVREWLSTKSYKEQYEFGLRVLRDHGVIK